MADPSDRWISEDEAARVWKRAAELQALSAGRLEERSRSLVPDEAPLGYRLEHVREAGLEAGIGPEFLDLALAELESPDPVEEGRVDRLSRRFLGRGPEALLVSRVMDARPERVFETLQRVLPSHPYALVLTDTRGPHPLRGGVLVFDVPALTQQARDFAYEMTWGDVKELHVRLQPLGSNPPRCEVTIRAPLGHSRRLNLWVGGGVTGFLALISGGFGVGLGAAVATAMGLGPGLLAAAVVAGGSAGGGAAGGTSIWGWRVLYRYAVARSEKALRKLLQQVNAQLQLGSMFEPPPAPG